MRIEIEAGISSWKLREAFSISRGTKTKAEVLDVRIMEDGRVAGRGEGVPYPRFGETPADSLTAVNAVSEELIRGGLSRELLKSLLPAGAARNALDAAIWDFEAKKKRQAVWTMIGLSSLRPVQTAYTISVDSAENMGRAAGRQKERPVLKIKLNGQGDLEKVAAVRKAAPHSRLIVDANESWAEDQMAKLVSGMKTYGVELIEQPLPDNKDDFLRSFDSPVPLCADESLKTIRQLPGIRNKYQCVNIKLDKTGGLTSALELFLEAKTLGLGTMVGCMVCTSLGVAPAMILAQQADWVDLDGPLLLDEDRIPAIRSEGSLIYPPEAALWGG